MFTSIMSCSRWGFAVFARIFIKIIAMHSVRYGYRKPYATTLQSFKNLIFSFISIGFLPRSPVPVPVSFTPSFPANSLVSHFPQPSPFSPHKPVPVLDALMPSPFHVPVSLPFWMASAPAFEWIKLIMGRTTEGRVFKPPPSGRL